jgi:hypothetical protein
MVLGGLISAQEAIVTASLLCRLVVKALRMTDEMNLFCSFGEKDGEPRVWWTQRVLKAILHHGIEASGGGAFPHAAQKAGGHGEWWDLFVSFLKQ